MSKRITMNRSELVWQTRENSFGEEEWELQKKLLLQRIEAAKDRDIGYYEAYNLKVYNIIKDIPWDEAYRQYQIYFNDDQTATGIIGWEVGNDEHYRYHETLGSWLQDILREDNYNSDIIDEEYADDYDEAIYFSEEDNDNAR